MCILTVLNAYFVIHLGVYLHTSTIEIPSKKSIEEKYKLLLLISMLDI